MSKYPKFAFTSKEKLEFQNYLSDFLQFNQNLILGIGLVVKRNIILKARSLCHTQRSSFLKKRLSHFISCLYYRPSKIRTFIVSTIQIHSFERLTPLISISDIGASADTKALLKMRILIHLFAFYTKSSKRRTETFQALSPRWRHLKVSHGYLDLLSLG